MSLEPHLIAPFNSSLNKFYKPWLIGQDAFPDIQDAYAWRGTVRKREGTRLLATLPTSPCQALKNWVNPSTLAQNLIGFSTTKSYLYNSGTGLFVDITFLADASAFSWSNGADDYFWTCNFAGSMFTTNNLTADHIRYFNGSSSAGWSVLQPIVNGSTTLDAALIILPYKGRLVVLNTSEGGNSFSNRARWCQLGTPYNLSDATHVPPSPFSADPNAWRDDIPGKGGFVDADTSERIVSAEIVRDTLIVFFSKSTWRLTYTGNEVLPFIWERLNTQYGSESTYSNVAFDDAALAFSRYGWIASTTNDVARIDQDIPDDSFGIEGTDASLTGLRRVQGIRDFYRQMAYWTYQPIAQSTDTKIYAYNYLDKTWSIFNPSIPLKCFGYYSTNSDITWNTLNATADKWQNYSGEDDKWVNFGVGEVIDFPYIVGGDVNGNVFQMFEFFQSPTIDGAGLNGGTTPTAPIQYGFSITTKRFNPYIKQGHRARINFVDLYFTEIPGGEITFQHFIDDQTSSPILTKTIQLSQRGAVNISSITQGTTTTINTATNHFLVSGELITMEQILGTAGRILNDVNLVATVISTTQFTVPVNTNGRTYIANTGVVYSSQRPVGDSKYVRIYLNVSAYMHQFVMTLTSGEIADPIKGVGQFELQGMVIWMKPASRIKG